MCILFIYRGEVLNQTIEYRLILASNRDEFYNRPALVAGPWVEDPEIIGGRDMEIGREGGSWLVMSPEHAKISVLLNLLGLVRKNAKGRGNLVSDFVNCNQSAEEYFKEITPLSDDYGYFNLVTVEIGSEDCSVHQFSNYDNKIHKGTDLYLGYGNTLLDKPLKKVVGGQEKFKKIVTQFGSKIKRTELVQQLLALLKCEEKYYPDEQLDKKAPNWAKSLSSIYVRMPNECYGTRTHTIILVDKDGKFEFIEETMKLPIDPSKPEWTTTHLKGSCHKN